MGSHAPLGKQLDIFEPQLSNEAVAGADDGIGEMAFCLL